MFSTQQPPLQSAGLRGYLFLVSCRLELTGKPSIAGGSALPTRACENGAHEKTRKQHTLYQERNLNQTSTTTRVIHKGGRLQIGIPAGMKLEMGGGD